ncbi:MAG: hypothetical protein IJK24_05310 [Oscillospiraceae bacterium]|jgi:hypothetical protein|nr:hypothetical protein [Oscillospiraceae bacterium]
MKIRKIIIVLCILFLAGCRASNSAGGLPIPDEVVFNVGMLCDLTDADGGTLHCGGPNDFYGNIPGKAGRMHGEGGDPAWFEFTVPYSASYTFSSTERPCLRTWPASLYCEGEASLLWTLDKWTVLSQGAEVKFQLSGVSADTDANLAEIRFHTDGTAEIGIQDGALTVNGASGSFQVAFWNNEMGRSVEYEYTAQGEQISVDFTGLTKGTAKVFDGKQTQELPVAWQP